MKMPSWTSRIRAPARSGVALVMLVVSLCLLFKAIPTVVAQSSMYPYDGYIDWGGGKELWEGHDPYGYEALARIGLDLQRGLGHPPTTLVWFYPFAHFDIMLMKHVFTVLTVLMLAFHVAIVVRELALPLLPFTSLLVFAGVYQADWFMLHL